MEPTWWIDAILAEEGQALLDQLTRDVPAPDDEIGVITRLRARHAPELVSAALEQAKLRVHARAKFANADRMYFTRAGLEQASSDRMARYHAGRYAPFDHMADLCTGIGGDLIGLAVDRRVLAVDRDPVHCRLAEINAQVNGVGHRVTIARADVREADLASVRAVFVDPARRSSDRRFPAGTSEPPLGWCFRLADRGIAVGIKAAPGLPTEVVPPHWELEFVSERGDLKESVLWSPALATAGRRATILPERHTLTGRDGAEVPLGVPGTYLLDPDPAVTRAGLVEELGMSLGGCWKIDPRIAFLSADHEMLTPFGRSLRVEASMPWSLRRLRDSLRALHVGVVDIRKRGSAVDVDDIQRRLKLVGDRSMTVVLTRVSDRPWALVCSSLDTMSSRRA